MSGVAESRGIHTLPVRGQTNDWITPREVLAALPPFDLDPCASETQPWATAYEMISPPQDGLAAEWHGRVWVNPPYGPDAGRFMEKLADHGDGIALVAARVETRWFFDQVWNRADAILFLFGRLYFHRPSGERASGNSGHPSVLVAYGRDAARDLGRCSLPGRFMTLEPTSLTRSNP